MTTKRKIAPPKPPPSPRFLSIVKEIEAFRDYLSVEVASLSDEEVSDLTTPIFSLYSLPVNEQRRRDRSGQIAAIIQAPREDWTTQ
jgi:hypothetical protein